VTASAVFHHLAEVEFSEAIEFYEAASLGLGEAFVNEIEHTIRLILDYPEAAPVVRGSIRKKLVRRFPYAILYRITPDGIRILAIMNLRRRPSYWRGRR
jgi:plasmid stabilization system protein ParE